VRYSFFGFKVSFAHLSTLLQIGIRIQQINHLTLFKFIGELGDRLQILLDKKI